MASKLGKSWGYQYDTYFQPENTPVKPVIFMLGGNACRTLPESSGQ